MSQQPWVVCYDISSNRNRNRALYALRKLSEGRQKSVFECWLNAREKAELFWQLAPLIDEGDSLFCFPISQARQVIRLGQDESPLFESLMVIG
ncbi:CRISPR-associated endonuclease Cas2 [Endozoicomonas sp.]|uniref:CRISPR-associated endonuclease Cas2 n=1 Tax=Endozoicomonas sp. TaxID=1892382 RepID=UPI00383A302A